MNKSDFQNLFGEFTEAKKLPRMTEYELESIFPYTHGYSTIDFKLIEFPPDLQADIARTLGEGRNIKTQKQNAEWFIKSAQFHISLYVAPTILNYPIGTSLDETIRIPIERLNTIKKSDIKPLLANVIDSANQLIKALDALPPFLELELRKSMDTPQLRQYSAMDSLIIDIQDTAKDLQRKCEQLPNHRKDETSKRNILIGPLIHAYRRQFKKWPKTSDNSEFVEAVACVFKWLEKEGYAKGLPQQRGIREWIGRYLKDQKHHSP
jgi:hypothetical protein